MKTDFPAYDQYRKARLHWLNQIPAHWEENRGKFYFREVDDRAKTGNEELLSVSHITGITPRSQKNVSMFKAENYGGHKLCQPGDIIINTMWAWMAALGVSKHTGIVSPAYGMYRPHNNNDYNSRYLDYLLRTRAYVSEYICRSTGIRSSRLRLYPDKFLAMLFIKPPRDEQDKIVAYLRVQDAHIARFIKIKRELIGLLNEQKQALIHQAVTKGINPNVKLKPSGVDWLGDIPESWEVKRLKWVCRLKYGDSLPDNLRVNGDYNVFGSNGVVGTHNIANTLSPCIIIGRKGSFGKINYSNKNTFAIDTYFVDETCTKGHIRWLYYLLLCCRLDSFSKDSAVPGLDRNDTYERRVPFYHYEQQKQIALWIDAETAEIDRAINRVENEILLVLEYRERLITDAVKWTPLSRQIIS